MGDGMAKLGWVMAIGGAVWGCSDSKGTTLDAGAGGGGVVAAPRDGAAGTTTGGTTTSPDAQAGARDAKPGVDTNSGSPADTAPTDTAPPTGASGRGFPALSPFLVYYDTAESLGNLSVIANKFRIIDIDVDPGLGNFTKAQVTQLKGGGKNRVLGYLNMGACENFRAYWATAPAGFLSCSANKAAQRGSYEGWPNETWMDLGNADYQKLVIDHMAAGVASLGVDGFYFDNLDIVDHGTNTTNGPCNAACVQGALDTVRKLREKYPDFLFVMQNAVGENTFEGTTGGVAFTSLLDGIVGENTFTPLPRGDASLLSDLKLWQGLNLMPGGRPFFIGTLEYLDSCDDTANLTKVVDLGKSNGFTSYVSVESLNEICPTWLK
jgi:cysteinyl-tRNA synthetase